MVNEFGARSIIDLSCGTGNLACRLAVLGKAVVGIDPAAASLDVAKQKQYADQVRWVHGSAPALTGLLADLIVMIGNVAQVFVTDDDWETTLRACQRALYPSGRLVFEVRDPAQEAWQGWTKSQTDQAIDAPGIDTVESWVGICLCRSRPTMTAAFTASNAGRYSDRYMGAMNRHILWDFDGTLAERPGLWSGCLIELLDDQAPGHSIDRERLVPHISGRAFPACS
jgi:SAM-dependent methyltransferase